MQKRVVEFEHEGAAVRITVGEATYQQGALRSVIAERQRRHMANVPVPEVDDDLAMSIYLTESALRMLIYPAIVAATLEVSGMAWPVAPEVIGAMDEQSIVAWEQAVFELNPDWVISEKKATTE